MLMMLADFWPGWGFAVLWRTVGLGRRVGLVVALVLALVVYQLDKVYHILLALAGVLVVFALEASGDWYVGFVRDSLAIWAQAKGESGREGAPRVG